MGRNLYILAATLASFALLSFGVSFSNIAQQPGSPGDRALWQTMSIGFLVLAMVIALAGMLSSLFEQAERRAEDTRRANRRNRSAHSAPRSPALTLPALKKALERNAANPRIDPPEH